MIEHPIKMPLPHFKLNIAICLAVLLFAVLSQVLGVSWNVDFFKVINAWGVSVDERVWSVLTLMGDTAILWPMLLIFSISSLRCVYAVLAAVPVGGLLSVLLKRLFDSPRPASVIDSLDIHVVGPILKTHSFPSGHTITIFATMGAIFLGLMVKNRWLDISIKATLVIFGLLVALSRVTVGAHWPVDCLAGAAIGWLSALSGIYLVNRFQNRLDGFKLNTLLVFLLWTLAISNFYRSIDYPASIIAVDLAFFVATMMLGLYLFKFRKSIASFLT